MGLLDSIYAISGKMAPLPEPVGVYTHMTRPEVTSLVMKESLYSISGDDFTIVSAETGKPLLKCAGKMFSMHDRKKIYDTEGNMLYNIADVKLARTESFVATNKDGDDVLTVAKKMSLGSKLKGTFQQNGQRRVLVVSGDFWGGSANIKLEDGTRLAHISRNVLNVNEAAADKQTYYLTIAPGVDIALIAAMCICFDEVENENQEQPQEDK